LERVLDYLPRPFRRRFSEGNQGPGGFGFWNPHGLRRPDAKAPDGVWIYTSAPHLGRYLLDAYNIEYGIMNNDYIGMALSPEPDYCAAMVSAMNDVLIHDWVEADPRLRLSLVVSPVDIDLAVREIHRLGDHPGVAQILMPGGAQKPYGQRYYHPIYAAAVEHDLPVALHPSPPGAGITGPTTAAGYPTSYFEWHTGLSALYVTHAISLISEGVFQKFPTLRFVLLEGGVSWLPPLLWRLDKNWKALRQTVPWVDRLPSEIAADHILLSTQPIEEPYRKEHLHQILSMFPAERMLMFSTDYPHWDGDTPDFAGRSLPESLRQRVLSETARELYKLPATKPALEGVAAEGARA
jgi:predicted TIM-barrel fold metal-dependent hydrolase